MNPLYIAVACLAVGSAAASEEWKPKYHAETRVVGAGGAEAISFKYPGAASAASLDIGTAYASDHFQGEITTDLSSADSHVKYAASDAGGSTFAFSKNKRGFTEGKSGTKSSTGVAGAHYPDIDQGAKADGFFDTGAAGYMTFSQGGQESEAHTDYYGDAIAKADAGTGSFEAHDAHSLADGAMQLDWLNTDGIHRLFHLPCIGKYCYEPED